MCFLHFLHSVEYLVSDFEHNAHLARFASVLEVDVICFADAAEVDGFAGLRSDLRLRMTCTAAGERGKFDLRCISGETSLEPSRSMNTRFFELEVFHPLCTSSKMMKALLTVKSIRLQILTTIQFLVARFTEYDAILRSTVSTAPFVLL